MARFLVRLLCCLALASPAAAAQRKRIVVFPLVPVERGAPPELGERMAAMLLEELGNQRPWVPVAPVDSRIDAEGAARSARELEAARREHAAAQAQLEAARSAPPARRAAALEAAADALLRSFPAAADFSPVLGALADAACVRLAAGDEAGAVAAMERHAGLAPWRLEPAAQLPPQLLAARNRWLRRVERGALRIDSQPAGASVTLDGRRLGATPLVVEGVAAGEHRVLVSREGFGARWATVAVRGGEATAFAAQLGGASGPASVLEEALAANRLDRGAVDAAVHLGKAARADFIVIGATAGEPGRVLVHAFLVRLADGAVGALAPVQVDPALLGASIEVLKVADAVDAAAARLLPRKLPLDVFPQPPRRATNAVAWGPSPEAASPGEDAGEPDAAAAGTPRQAAATGELDAAERARREAAAHEAAARRRFWKWTAAGSAAAVLLGVTAWAVFAPPPPPSDAAFTVAWER